MVYAMKYAKNLGIAPLELEYEPTQRVNVREKMTVTDLVKLLDIPKEVIVDENPSLLTTLIPADFTLNLPVSKITSFNSFQDSLYAFAEDVTVGQKLSIPVVMKPESSPKELPQTASSENKEGEEFSTQPVTSSKTSKKQSKTKEPASTASANEKGKLKKVEKPIASAPVNELDEKRNHLKQKNTKAPVSDKNLTVKPIPSPKIDLPYIVKEDDDNYRVLVYSVKKDDNLGYISQWFHCKVSEIRRWNELNGNFIDIDQELLVYVHKNDFADFVRFNYLSMRLKDMLSERIETQEEKDAVTAKAAENSKQSIVQRINPVKYFHKDECFEVYTIRSGDNLWTIAEQYDDISVQDLMQWNGYKKNPVLKPGDEIKVRKVPCR
jgi:LysM repeat protein